MSLYLTLPRLAASRPGASSGLAVSLAIAAGVCAAFAGSALASPATALPATGAVAAFLFLAVEHDVRSLRLPNWLTLGTLAAVLAHAAATGGAARLGHALSGAGLALAALIVPFALRGLGAGDVKASMALGALWGPEFVVPVLFWALIAGGALAIARVVSGGEFTALCERWGRSAWLTLSTRRLTYFAPDAGSAAAGGLPFAVALGVGATLHQLWGGIPWV